MHIITFIWTIELRLGSQDRRAMLHGSTAQVTLKPKCGSITIFEGKPVSDGVYHAECNVGLRAVHRHCISEWFSCSYREIALLTDLKIVKSFVKTTIFTPKITLFCVMCKETSFVSSHPHSKDDVYKRCQTRGGQWRWT